MITETIKKLESIIEEYNWAQVKVKALYYQMVDMKDDIIHETRFIKEYAKLDKCPFEHNELTYRAWKDDLQNNLGYIFEEEYCYEKDINGFYSLKDAKKLEDLFEIYKNISNRNNN